MKQFTTVRDSRTESEPVRKGDGIVTGLRLVHIQNLQQKIPLSRQRLDRDYNRYIQILDRDTTATISRQYQIGGCFQIDPVIKIFTTENISG